MLSLKEGALWAGKSLKISLRHLAESRKLSTRFYYIKYYVNPQHTTVQKQWREPTKLTIGGY
jgi:hypothetical protein